MRPGGAATPLANGVAFGRKLSSLVERAARTLADATAAPCLLSREDADRLGPKRPPVGGGTRPDGTGVLRVAATPGIAAAIAAVAPGLVVEEVPVSGPTSTDLRAAGWAEAAVLLAAVSTPPLTRPPCARRRGAEAHARVHFGDDPRIEVQVSGCGPVLDEIVLRSYCVGAAHMGLGWVCSEGLAVDESGDVRPHHPQLRHPAPSTCAEFDIEIEARVGDGIDQPPTLSSPRSPPAYVASPGLPHRLADGLLPTPALGLRRSGYGVPA